MPWEMGGPVRVMLCLGKSNECGVCGSRDTRRASHEALVRAFHEVFAGTCPFDHVHADPRAEEAF